MGRSKEVYLEGCLGGPISKVTELSGQTKSCSRALAPTKAMRPIPAKSDASSPKWWVQGRPFAITVLSSPEFSFPQFAVCDEEWYRIGRFSQVNLPPGLISVF